MELSEETYLLFAAKAYTNSSCSGMEEFYDDLGHIIHIKKILTKYSLTGELKTRLIINHLISFFNVFESPAAIQILFFKISSKNHSTLKTVLKHIDRCPDILHLYDEVQLKNIKIDKELLSHLSKNIE